MCDSNVLGAPVHCNANVFIMRCIKVTARGLQVMVWHERKQAVGIFVAISELDHVAVGFEALVIIILCVWSGNNAKEDVIFHEVVLWCGVTSVAVDQNCKVSVGEIWMRLDQSVGLASIDLFLQLEQNILLVLEEGVDNLLSIWSPRKTARKKSKAATFNRHLTVHLNGFGAWQGVDLIHATYCSRCMILNFLTVPVNLKTTTTKNIRIWCSLNDVDSQKLLHWECTQDTRLLLLKVKERSLEQEGLMETLWRIDNNYVLQWLFGLRSIT